MRKLTIIAFVMATVGIVGYGFALGNKSTTANTKKSAIASIRNGKQYVESVVEPSRYEPIIVQRGIPVEWTLIAEKKALNGCNGAIQIPSLKITKELAPGKNVVEFTPKESGIIPFTCWMGMIKSSIVVVDNLESASTTSQTGALVQEAVSSGSCNMVPNSGCCGGPKN